MDIPKDEIVVSEDDNTTLTVSTILCDGDKYFVFKQYHEPFSNAHRLILSAQDLAAIAEYERKLGEG